WRDKRTRIFRRVKWVLFAAAFLLLALSVWLTVVEHRSQTQQAAQAEQRDRATQARLGQLLDSNHALETELAPFAKVASQLFPSLPPASRLARLETQLSQLSHGVEELKSRSAPWELTKEQVTLLAKHLKTTPKGRVAIEYIRSDEARSRKFAVELRDILKSAG